MGRNGKYGLSRRDFLGRMLWGTSALVFGGNPLFSSPRNVKIAAIDLFPVVYPMRGRFKFFEGPDGHMRGRASAIIRITADNGVTGWGESVPIPRWSYETLETVVSTIRNYLVPDLIGRNPFGLQGIHRIMNRNIAPSFSTGQPMAKAGVDIALHDLIGRVTGQSVPEMWGMDPAEELTLSWTLNPKTLDDLDPLIQEGLDRGYNHFNVKVAPDPDFDLELCRRVRKRVPEGFLWADANGGYDTATALAVAPRLADAGVDVLEQPLRADRISGYRALRKQGALPILMDEGVVSPSSLEEFIKLDMLDGVAMKPARCGGLLPARRQIEILLEAGLLFLGSGLTDPDISLAATLALYGAFRYKRPAALNGPQFIARSVLKTPLVPKDGKLKIPSGPGLGIEVDEEKIRALTVPI
jgi:L-alanine-DL-glutamate epimerase-like enolase superfamily enzyme